MSRSNDKVPVQKMIEGYTENHLLKTAKGVVEKKTKNSTVLDREAEDRIPKFEMRELKLGKVLGRGGFCVVNEITKITLLSEPSSPSATSKDDSENAENHGVFDGSHNSHGNTIHDDEHHFHNIVQDRSFMEKYCIRGKHKDARYAIKRLQESSKKDAQTFINGVVDLAIEARFLSVIRHPNIIKMRAMASGSPYDAHFFVVLDRLYDIMSQRIPKWKRQQVKGVKKLIDLRGKKEMAFWVERVTVAYDLSCAVKYLHDLNIVYRDLKPDNIGFDVRGDVKIFDFGLAKELDPSLELEDGTYKLTGDTGSPRYMAPEVALGEPYNENVDTYSFCILLWQILKLETPFEGYTMNMFNKKVVRGGHRPMCDPKWPDSLTETMKLGWGDRKSRPSMDDVSICLRDEINRNTDEEISEIMDASRKSELSLHRHSQHSAGSSSHRFLSSR